ncbi:MAG TPA: hypothetical protein PKE63_00245 [Lacibacter sp.]|nr:hypothetical protein [Lacibacter sp.]HMO87744.1 hypothetical protein [Lacibacter sp.]HMP85672.1 hypothetical protein [Lacibacter sp.]
MNERLLHIIRESGEVSEQELLDYIHNRLSPEQRHAVEERLAAHELLSDAEEGLELIQDKNQLPEVVARLNRQLAGQLREKRHQPRRPLPSMGLLIMATFLILLLIVMAFFVIYNLQKG